MPRSRLTVCVDRAYLSAREERRNVCIVVERDSVVSVEGGSRGAGEVYDYRGLGSVAVPGIVDLHVHLRGLLQSYKEDEESGTKAAARGGVAVVADMPNTTPFLNTWRAVREKLEALEEGAVVDYALYSGVPDNYRELERILELPIAGFKIYPKDYGGSILCKLFSEASRRGLLVVVHPEDPYMSRVEAGWSREVYQNCSSELSAVDYMLSLYYSCGKPRIHFTHLSCPTVFERVLRKALAGEKVSCDTTPHHLLASMKTSKPFSWYCYEKVNPPLRSQLKSWTLFQKIVEAVLSSAPCSIASDHAPHADWEKREHPFLCPPGIASLEYWPGAVARIAERRLVDIIIAATSTNPARTLGLKKLGEIKPGSTASITVFGPPGRSLYTPKYSRARHAYYSMLEGLETLLTLVRGRPVYTAGEGVLADPGYGKNVVNLEERTTL